MKNQAQALPENTETDPQSNTADAPQAFTPDASQKSLLFPGATDRETVAELESLLPTADGGRPTELELIQFSEIYRRCTDDDDKPHGCATAQLRGFYELIRDNPRIRPLSEALGAMCAADDYLHKVTGLIRKI